MNKNSRVFQARLPVQVVAILICLAAFTALAIGLPSMRLMQRQMDRQAWSSLDQAGWMASAALTTETDRIGSLARLIAERPTLLNLLVDNRSDELPAYIETLRVGAGLDLLAICRDAEVVSLVVDPTVRVRPEFTCIDPAPGRIFHNESIRPTGWLMAAHPVEGSTDGLQVMVGHAVDANLINRLRLQDDIDVGLIQSGVWIAGTRPEKMGFWSEVRSRLSQDPGKTETGIIDINAESYYARRALHPQSGAEIITALPVTQMIAAQNELKRTLVYSILAVILAASFLAFYLAQRLMKPLERLRAAAVSLSMGDLTTPVTTHSRVREISQVAYALEDARSALNHSLQALQREKEWSELLLASVVEGIIALDRRGRITFFSQGAERITKRRSNQVVGRHIDDVIKVIDGEQRLSQYLQASGGRQAVLTIEHGGHPITLAVTGAPFTPPEAGRGGSALVLRDVSEEEALRRLLGDFLANITHEFRTPLSALAASIELILDQLDALSPTDLRELLDSLRLGTLGLQTLIDNLLEGASIEAGRFHVYPRPAELEEVVRDTARTLQPLFEKYHQQLKLDIPPGLLPVQIDPRRTTQVLVNLLSNAIKWSPEDSEIQLIVKQNSRSVYVSVSDRGPGIPENHLTDVYTRFSHLSTSIGRTEHGAGLGLSVVKAIVEAQGGEVGVENRPGGGARFWFSIPVSTTDLETQESHPTAASGTSAEIV